jgi:hypothetical protein
MAEADTEYELKTLKVIKFSGEKADWYEWSEKFKCLAGKRLYLDVLLGTTVAPPDVQLFDPAVMTAEEIKERKDAKKGNKDGFSDLLLSVSGLAFNIVNLCKTPELPGGDLKLAWESLMEHYDLHGLEDRIVLLERFTKNKLYDAKNDVMEWITSLKIQRVKLMEIQFIITEEHFFTHILTSLPREYDNLVVNVKISLRSPTGCDLKELIKRLKDKYNRIKLRSTSTNQESASFVTNNKGNNSRSTPKKRSWNQNGRKDNKPRKFAKKFKGIYHKRGNMGHKSFDCRHKLFDCSEDENYKQKIAGKSRGKEKSKGNSKKEQKNKDFQKIRRDMASYCYICKEKGKRTNNFNKKWIKESGMMCIECTPDPKQINIFREVKAPTDEMESFTIKTDPKQEISLREVKVPRKLESVTSKTNPKQEISLKEVKAPTEELKNFPRKIRYDLQNNEILENQEVQSEKYTSSNKKFEIEHAVKKFKEFISGERIMVANKSKSTKLKKWNKNVHEKLHNNETGQFKRNSIISKKWNNNIQEKSQNNKTGQFKRNSKRTWTNRYHGKRDPIPRFAASHLHLRKRTPRTRIKTTNQIGPTVRKVEVRGFRPNRIPVTGKVNAIIGHRNTENPNRIPVTGRFNDVIEGRVMRNTNTYGTKLTSGHRHRKSETLNTKTVLIISNYENLNATYIEQQIKIKTLNILKNPANLDISRKTLSQNGKTKNKRAMKRNSVDKCEPTINVSDKNETSKKVSPGKIKSVLIPKYGDNKTRRVVKQQKGHNPKCANQLISKNDEQKPKQLKQVLQDQYKSDGIEIFKGSSHAHNKTTMKSTRQISTYKNINIQKLMAKQKLLKTAYSKNVVKKIVKLKPKVKNCKSSVNNKRKNCKSSVKNTSKNWQLKLQKKLKLWENHQIDKRLRRNNQIEIKMSANNDDNNNKTMENDNNSEISSIDWKDKEEKEMKLWPHCWCAIYEHIYKKATRGGFYSEESKKKKIVAYQGSNYPYEDDYGDADECLVGIDNEPTIVAIENNIEQLGWKTPYCDTRWKENDITCQQIQILQDEYQQTHKTRWPNHIKGTISVITL